MNLFAHAICGVDQLADFQSEPVTHVLSLLDPDWPAIDAFAAFGTHERVLLPFHDIISETPDKVMPGGAEMDAILRLGAELAALAVAGAPVNLLVHCHMGVSRSTAATVTILAQSHPDVPEDEVFAHLRAIRPQAWPNSVMIGLADTALGRKGRLVAALRAHYAHQLAAQPQYREWMSRLGREREVAMGETADGMVDTDAPKPLG